MDIYRSGQSIAMIAVRFNLGHQITYNISTGHYLNGANVASNFIAEMLEFGLIGVFCFSIIVSKLVTTIENKIIEGNIFFIYMSFEFCRWIFLMPRAELFYDSYNMFKYSLFFMLLYIVSRPLYTKKSLNIHKVF